MGLVSQQSTSEHSLNVHNGIKYHDTVFIFGRITTCQIYGRYHPAPTKIAVLRMELSYHYCMTFKMVTGRFVTYLTSGTHSIVYISRGGIIIIKFCGWRCNLQTLTKIGGDSRRIKP